MRITGFVLYQIFKNFSVSFGKKKEEKESNFPYQFFRFYSYPFDEKS